MKENRVDRIKYMEQILNEAADAVKAMETALDQYEAVQERMGELIRYYESPQWMADFEADNAGLIPKDLKRGVLSEDGVYNLLEELQELRERLKQNADII